MTSTALAYSTSSHAVRVTDRIARVRAAGRVAAERKAADARRARAWALTDATGQAYANDWSDVDFCFICGRCTDHTGEHTPDQIAAWREGRA
jgi:hypothetical protein